MRLTCTILISILAASNGFSQSITDTRHDVVMVPADEQQRPSGILKSKRIQLDIRHGQASLFITPIDRIPRQLKRIEFYITDIEGNSIRKTFNRKAIARHLAEWQDTTIAMLKERLYFNPDSSHTLDAYRQAAQRFACGKNGGYQMMNQWQRLVLQPLDTGMTLQQIRIRMPRSKPVIYKPDALASRPMLSLPVIDESLCRPYDRQFERKELLGYGLDQVPYKPHTPGTSHIVRKTFTLYFEKSGTEPHPAELKEIQDYLHDNHLTILNATVEGYSSIEGAVELNSRLQQERANVLMSTLLRFNDEPILSDTLIITDGWQELRELLMKANLHVLDSMTLEQARETVRSEESFATLLEPYLKEQRKAKLTLVTRDTYSGPELQQRILNDVSRELVTLTTTTQRPDAHRGAERNLLGMLDYVDALVDRGKLNADAVTKLLKQSTDPGRMQVLYFYHIVRKLERQRQTIDLDSLLASMQWNQLFQNTHRNLLDLAANASTQEERRTRIRQEVDLQYFMDKYIREGLLDADALCEMDYPNSRTYYGLLLNHYAMLYQYARQQGIRCFTVREIYCQDCTRRDTTVSLIAPNKTSLSETNPDSRPSLFPPAYNEDPKSDYYFFLKTLFHTKDESIRSFVRTSDQVIEFDLYDFLTLNVGEWDPFSNYYYDRDLQIIQLNGLVATLKQLDKHFCKQQVNGLYLTFHMKALHYLSLYWSPLEREYVKIADQSLSFVSDYYKRHQKRLDPKTRAAIQQQINYFQWIPTRKTYWER